MSDVTSGVNTSENYDAQQTIEEISAGDRKAPDANVEADYEASKQFSVSEIDRTEAGAAAAEAVTTPDLDVPSTNLPTSSPDTTGNPDDYRQMAGDLSSTPSAPAIVNDDLVKKALEKGAVSE